MFQQINPSQIVIDRMFQGLCCKPFHGHPKGCPNFGKKTDCPPCSLLENDFLDFTRELFVIYTAFKVGEFAEQMRQKHPQWAGFPRQWYNPRRWQPQARAMHREDIRAFRKSYPDTMIDHGPEARGVNITELMKSIGINLDWRWPPPHILEEEQYKNNITYRVSLAGYLINSPR
jgi:hypothetical protein